MALSRITNPFLSSSGAGNASITSPAANTVAFTTATTERMRIDSSGNVGIGTSSPTEKVTSSNGFLSTGAVSSTARDGALVDFTASVSRFIAGRSGGNFGQWEAHVAGASGVTKRYQIDYEGTHHWYAADGTTERARIDSSGNVGIGTSSPSVSGLDISKATGVSPTPVELRLATTTNDSGWSTSNPWGRISFYSADASVGGAKVHASIQTTAQSSSGGNSNLDFFVTDTANGTLFKTLSFQGAGTNTTQTMFYSGGGTEAMRIESSGNLLVGASSSTWLGSLLKSGGTITLASGASINLSSSVCGGAIVSVYVTGSGNGGLFYLNYSAVAAKITGDGAATDTGSDFAVYKSAASHISTLKNKSVSTQTFSVVVVAGQIS